MIINLLLYLASTLSCAPFSFIMLDKPFLWLLSVHENGVKKCKLMITTLYHVGQDPRFWRERLLGTPRRLYCVGLTWGHKSCHNFPNYLECKTYEGAFRKYNYTCSFNESLSSLARPWEKVVLSPLVTYLFPVVKHSCWHFDDALVCRLKQSAVPRTARAASSMHYSFYLVSQRAAVCMFD